MRIHVRGEDNLLYHILAHVRSENPAGVFHPGHAQDHPLGMTISEELTSWMSQNIGALTHFPFVRETWSLHHVQSALSPFKLEGTPVASEFAVVLLLEWLSYQVSWKSRDLSAISRTFSEQYGSFLICANAFFAQMTNRPVIEDLQVHLIEALSADRGKQFSYPHRRGIAVSFPQRTLIYLFTMLHELAHHYSDAELVGRGFSLPRENEGPLYVQREATANLLTKLFFDSLLLTCPVEVSVQDVPEQIQSDWFNKLSDLPRGITMVNLGSYAQSFAPPTHEEQLRRIPDAFLIGHGEAFSTVFLARVGRLLRVPNIYWENVEQMESKAAYLEHFKRAGFLVGSAPLPPVLVTERSRSMVAEQRRSMVKFRFHMTERCQLRCEYCYLNAGEAGQSLSIEVARQALQTWLPENYKGQVEVEFHGGGEPTLAFEAIKAIVEEVRSLPVKPQFRLQTNGLMSREVLDWLLNEQVQISVSIDGAEETQQLQRPGAKGAWEQMLGTIEALALANVSFNTISVVSAYSLNVLDESYEFLKSLGVKAMLFNPLHELGRALEGAHSHQNAVDLMAFVQKFLSVRLRADQDGIRVMSDFLPDFYHYHPRDFQCNACRPTACVHVNGDLVACTRAYDILPRDQNPFVWARYEEGTWQMDESKTTALENRTLENMPACQGCLVKWDCAGDCLIELYKKKGDFYQVDEGRCEAKRWFVRNYLAAFSENYLA